MGKIFDHDREKELRTMREFPDIGAEIWKVSGIALMGPADHQASVWNSRKKKKSGGPDVQDILERRRI